MAGSGFIRKNRGIVAIVVAFVLGCVGFVSCAGIAALPLAALFLTGSGNSSTCTPVDTSPSTGGLDPGTGTPTEHARTFIGVAKTVVGATDWPRAAELVVGAGLDESSLRNYWSPAVPESASYPNDGEHSPNGLSVGLLQQQKGYGWGTVQQTMDPAHAAWAFLTYMVANVPDWQSLPFTVAIHDVQGNLDPGVYAPFEDQAIAIVAANATTPAVPLDSAGNFVPPASAPPKTVPTPKPSSPILPAAIVPTPRITSRLRPAPTAMPTATLVGGSCGQSGIVAPNGSALAVIAAAKAELGIPYSWGGGNDDGPTLGSQQGANTVGFDCSSFTMYAYWQGAHIQLPRTSDAQMFATQSRQVIPDVAHLQAGDLLFYHYPSDNSAAGHVTMYIGDGMIIEAPHTGEVVHIVPIYYDYLVMATRVLGTDQPVVADDTPTRMAP